MSTTIVEAEQSIDEKQTHVQFDRSVIFHDEKARFSKKKTLSWFYNKEYDKLNDYIALFRGTPELEGFLVKQGFTLVHHAVVICIDTISLSFVLKEMPISSISSILQQNDYEILYGFLGVQWACELRGDAELRSLGREKLKLLATSAIIKNIIQDFKTQHAEHHYMLKSIKSDFDAALESSERKYNTVSP